MYYSNHYLGLIDNLQKGAAGQAVQCLNLSQNFEEHTGLILWSL